MNDTPTTDPKGFYVKMHKKYDELLKKLSKSMKISMALLILNALICLLFQKNIWVRGFTVTAIILMTWTIYNTSRSIMKLYQSRIMIMNDLIGMLAEMGCLTAQVFGEKLIEVTEKYNDKKARLDDLIGPDFEDTTP